MPHFVVTRTFLLLNLILTLYRTSQMLIIKNGNYNFCLLKPSVTLLLFIILAQSTNLGGARLSKNRRKLKVKRHLQHLPEDVWAQRVSAGAASGKLIWYWAVKFFEEQRLFGNFLVFSKSYMNKKVNKK